MVHNANDKSWVIVHREWWEFESQLILITIDFSPQHRNIISKGLFLYTILRILLTEDLQYFGPGEFSVQLEEAYKHFLDFCRTRRIPHTQPPFLRKMVTWIIALWFQYMVGQSTKRITQFSGVVQHILQEFKLSIFFCFLVTWIVFLTLMSFYKHSMETESYHSLVKIKYCACHCSGKEEERWDPIHCKGIQWPDHSHVA